MLYALSAAFTQERIVFMADIIVTIILVVFNWRSSYIHSKSEEKWVKCIGCPAGGNCPGSGKLPKKKLDGPVAGRKTMQISGMNCAHCAMDVTRALNQIDGVRAEVSLAKGRARITFDREIDDAELISAVETAGFQVESIKP